MTPYNGYYCRAPYMAHAKIISARNKREARKRFRNWLCEIRCPRGTTIVLGFKNGVYV